MHPARRATALQHIQFLPAITAVAAAMHVLLCIGTLLTLRPWIDEAWHAVPGWTLATAGYLGTPAYYDRRVPGIEHHTYWIMPVYPLLQAAWYQVAPFRLEAARALSVIFSVSGLLLWGSFLLRMTADRWIAGLFVALLSVDYLLVNSGGFGRPDIVAFAFQAGALAAYAHWRERDLTRAMLLSQTCVVLSGMTHPNGGLLSFLALAIVTLSLDRRRIEARHLLAAAIPYAAGAVGWGSYILQSPQTFFAQYGFQTGMRFTGLLDPLQGIRDEATRYLINMGLSTHSVGSTGPHFLKSAVFVFYGMSLAGVLAIPALRRDRFVQLALRLTGAFLVYYTFLEATKASYYFIYLIALYTAIAAVFLVWCWRQNRLWLRLAVAGTLTVVMTIQAGGCLYRMRRNPWGKEFNAAVDALRQRARPGERIAGSHELGFALGFHGSFEDDYMLGLETGRMPDWVVAEQVYDDHFDALRKQRPGDYVRLQARLAEYEQVWAIPTYRLLARKGVRPPAAMGH